jgi:hypothetical protein
MHTRSDLEVPVRGSATPVGLRRRRQRPPPGPPTPVLVAATVRSARLAAVTADADGGSASGTLTTTAATTPPPADTVTIARPEWTTGLPTSSDGSSPDTLLSACATASGSLMSSLGGWDTAST